MKIVITGGSRGIGKMIADAIAKTHEVVIISKSKNSVSDAVKELEGNNCVKRTIMGFVADVSDFKSMESVFAKIGLFDVLINCAGILGPVGSFHENDIEEWEKTISVNLFGTVNSCKAAIPYLVQDSNPGKNQDSGQENEKGKDRKNSKIINISGGGSAFPRIYHTAYASSKAAVVRFTENLALDCQNDKINIDCNVIAPGAHKTGLWQDETHDTEPEKWDDPKLLIKLIEFLLSNKSDGITGKFLHIKDDYELLDQIVSSSELFTLRRIDNYKFKETD